MAEQIESILNMNDNAIIKKVNYEMEKIIDNIKDFSTDEKARELSIKIKLIPNSTRDGFKMEALVAKKLRPTTNVESQVKLEEANGEIIGYELNGISDGQLDLNGKVHHQKFIKVSEA